MAWRERVVAWALLLFVLGEDLEGQVTWYLHEAAPVGGSRDTVLMAEAGVEPSQGNGTPTPHHMTQMRFGGRF